MASTPADTPKPTKRPTKPKPEVLKGPLSHGKRLWVAGTPTSELEPPLSDEQRARLKRLGVL